MNIIKLVALGVAEIAIDKLDVVLHNTSDDENRTKEEKTETAAHVDNRDFFQKIIKTASNTAQRVQDTIEKREQEKQASYDAEIKRLSDTYPLYLSFRFVNDQWIDGAEVLNKDGTVDLRIKTRCPSGKRMAFFLDKNGGSVVQIKENDSQFDFGIFGTKQKETFFLCLC